MNEAAQRAEANEAFALMWYACECGHRERIWNARSGVTPFGMGCPSCGNPTLRHVDWGRDARKEDHTPHPGQRVWIDLTIQRARERARLRIASAPPEYQPAESEREELIERVAQHEYAAFGAGMSPDSAVVGTQALPVKWRPSRGAQP